MPDISTKGRWAFWTMILAVVLFSTIPSMVLIDKARDYWRFLSGWSPGALKQLRARRMPPARDRFSDLDLHFVEFKLRAPEAKTVRLASNFNRWDPGSMPLRLGEDGVWETAVPLPPGTYQYAFEVDGAWTPDPATQETSSHGERQVSVRRVP